MKLAMVMNKTADGKRELANGRRHTPDGSRQGVKIFLLFAFCLLFSFPLSASAQNLPDLPFDYQPTGMVNDFANIIPPQKQHRLEMKLRNYRDSTTTALVVATLPDLKGYNIQRVGTYLFSKWNIWYKKRFNGVLILIAPNEQKVRIEVGYGLEGAITDIMSGRIIRNILIPEFKQGDYYAGLDKATSAMISLASGLYEDKLPDELKQARPREGGDLASFIIFLLFIAFVVYSSARRGGKGGGKHGRRRKHSTLGPAGLIFLGMGMGGLGEGDFEGGDFGGGDLGGGGFGGFGGMGGFGSGGGGAGGGW